MIMDKDLRISIIIPVYNDSHNLSRCLKAISLSTHRPHEVIVVDDCSTDDSARISRIYGARSFQLTHQSGPGAARNYGSKRATGDILFFIDSDVLIKSFTIERLVEDFKKNDKIAAMFGSYDDSPSEKNFISQYKNLLHHFVHQNSNKEAMTFWAGCGAIRREVFDKVGGFDQDRYDKPLVEDIELGYRMKSMGYRILLNKDLQVKHLKQWNLVSLLRADIFYRAIPWSKLIIKSGDMISDLNLQFFAKISSILIGLAVGLLPITFFKPQLIYLISILLLIIIILNFKFYQFLSNRNGLLFAVSAFPLHLIYYFYSGLIFGSFQVISFFSGKKSF